MALNVTFLDSLDNSDLNVYRAQPFKKGDLLQAKIKNFSLLAQGEDIKTVYSLKFENKEKIDYLPGDTIGILPSNDPFEVQNLLIRLNWENIANTTCKLERGDGKSLPAHLPPVATLLKIFMNHINIRMPPKKTFITAMIPFCSDEKEKELLSTLVSPKGKEKYANLITGSGSTLLGFFNEFPSILPPVDKVLLHLSPLLPRYYSICSCPLSEANELEIAFFVSRLTSDLKGVCTGWLESLIKRKSNEEIPIYLRASSKFVFSESNNDIPTILIATGTGISPFISFLRYRLALIKKSSESSFGNIILYYGCRYEKDFLFKDEIKQFLDNGILSCFYSSFSRESSEKKYVQHRIWENRQEFYDLLVNKQAKVYICGSKDMVKDVKATLVNAVKEIDNCDESIAVETIKNMESKGNILIDLWT